jgi:hypothetical protein
MKTNTAFALFIFGLLLTMLGVGGIEQSVENTALISSLAVSVLGLALMYVGTLGVRGGEYYDQGQ